MEPQQKQPQLQEPQQSDLRPKLEPSVTPEQRKSFLPVLSMIFAFLLPPLGFFLSIATFVYMRMRKQKIGLTIAAAIVSIINTGIILGGTFIALVGSTLFLAAGGNNPNQAFDDVQPFIESVQSIGGTELCTAGDNGYSISNTIPWHNSYVKIPDSRTLTVDIAAAAAEKGVVLEDQASAIDIYTPDASEVFGAPIGESSLRLYIYRDTSVPLRCDNGEYGRQQVTGSDAILLISATAPEADR